METLIYLSGLLLIYPKHFRASDQGFSLTKTVHLEVPPFVCNPQYISHIILILVEISYIIQTLLDI